MNYVLLKYVHIFCVAASFALFFVRGLWTLQTYPPAPEAWVRMLPHAVDGLLLVSAIGMIVTATQFDWSTWLQVKLVLVVVFVVMGVLVFRSSTRRPVKAIAWLLGLLLFLFITTVALLHQPLGILTLL
jgi:uncharacterized membrane protein SirB2